tara:strand:+ start:2563 stop:2946 length:384 start_codon:yes stop_codon:yes gene_type:complete
MGNRVSVSFIDGDTNRESVALFHHWGGEDFAIQTRNWFRTHKTKLSVTAEQEVKNGLDPMTRFEPANLMVQYVNNLHKSPINCEMGDDLEFTPDYISHSIYLGKDENDGDNSDNGHFTIDINTGEIL